MGDVPKSQFDPDVVYEVFKKVWARSSKEAERGEKETDDNVLLEGASVAGNDASAAAGPSRKARSTSANANALKLTCEVLSLFVSETVQRAAMVAEAEGSKQVEGSHLERILPQLLLDF